MNVHEFNAAILTTNERLKIPTGIAKECFNQI